MITLYRSLEDHEAAHAPTHKSIALKYERWRDRRGRERERPGHIQELFEDIGDAIDDDPRLAAVVRYQISTRSGRVLASTVPDIRKRELLAELTACAHQLARTSDANSPAIVQEGETQLMVLELPQRRLLMCLLDASRDTSAVPDAIEGQLPDHPLSLSSSSLADVVSSPTTWASESASIHRR